MAYPYFCGETLDDVMRSVIEEIQSKGEWVRASKGNCKELIGVLLELTNPRARLSRTETRGKPFSCLGELCWYLAKTNRLDFIEYYIGAYKDSADGEIIFGGYGPRLFDWRNGIKQWENVASLLNAKRSSRQAVIQLFDAEDILKPHKDIPCTCTLQFLIRGDRLHLLVNMRSNDAFLGLPHDIFAFTMLQEIMARSLNAELGIYKHAVGSFHLYEKDLDDAQRFLDEGWQSTDTAMPPMPKGDPWPSIVTLMKAENSIRTSGDSLCSEIFEQLDPYWADLVRLLKLFRLAKNNDNTVFEMVAARMYSAVYNAFIFKKLDGLRSRK